jgi:hypothetical protein
MSSQKAPVSLKNVRELLALGYLTLPSNHRKVGVLASSILLVELSNIIINIWLDVFDIRLL